MSSHLIAQPPHSQQSNYCWPALLCTSCPHAAMLKNTVLILIFNYTFLSLFFTAFPIFFHTYSRLCYSHVGLLETLIDYSLLQSSVSVICITDDLTMICNGLYIMSPRCKFLLLYCFLPSTTEWHRKWSPSYFHCEWQACYWRSLNHTGECSTSWRFRLAITKKVYSTIHQDGKQRETLLKSKKQKLFCFSVETKESCCNRAMFLCSFWGHRGLLKKNYPPALLQFEEVSFVLEQKHHATNVCTAQNIDTLRVLCLNRFVSKHTLVYAGWHHATHIKRKKTKLRGL